MYVLTTNQVIKYNNTLLIIIQNTVESIMLPLCGTAYPPVGGSLNLAILHPDEIQIDLQNYEVHNI